MGSQNHHSVTMTQKGALHSIASSAHPNSKDVKVENKFQTVFQQRVKPEKQFLSGSVLVNDGNRSGRVAISRSSDGHFGIGLKQTDGRMPIICSANGIKVSSKIGSIDESEMLKTIGPELKT